MYITKYLAYLYVLGFLLPYLLQLFWLESTLQQRVALVICFVTQVFFYLIELKQMNYSGIYDYFSEFWNKIDTMLFILYTTYFVVRWSHTNDH